MAKIFISYRREDSQHPVHRMHKQLSRYVKNPRRDIFIDVDSIPLGINFKEIIFQTVGACEILLCVIGPDWLKKIQQRADDPKDFVRIEIEAALARNIPVVPILLDGTPMPDEDELPESIRPLHWLNGKELRSQTFDANIEQLAKGLGLQGETAAPGRGLMTALMTVIVSAAGTFLVWQGGLFDGTQTPSDKTEVPPVPHHETAALQHTPRIDGAWQTISLNEWSIASDEALFEKVVSASGYPSLNRAADSAEPSAATILGMAYEHGLSPVLQADYFRAVEYYRLGCDAEIMRACMNLGYHYETSLNNYDRARELYQQSCDGMIMWGCHLLGALYSSDQIGFERDIGRAIDSFARACRGGYKFSCNHLGLLYQNGNGTPIRFDLARTYYDLGCDADGTGSCTNLGYLYEFGLGGRQDLAKAVELYTRSCENSEMIGCTYLGLLYSAGRGVQQDHERARALYAKACDEDHDAACENLLAELP